MTNPTSRGRLFRKYVVVLLVLVGGVLMASSLVELYFSYRETQRAIVRVERAKAVAAAARIEQFLKEVELQVRETTRTASDDPDASQVGPGRLGFREGLGAALAQQRELDFLRVLRNVPAISELSHLDLSGKEQIRVSRLDPDIFESHEDFSQAPKFVEARAGKTYWSPVYFKNESEPYVTLAVPVGKYAVEVTTAEVNLGGVLRIVSQIEVGPGGYAYVVDSRNYLVAHPDSRVLREKRDLSTLVQVKSARAERSGPTADAPVTVVAEGLGAGQVLAAHAAIAPLGWLVFVERPAADAYAPLRAPIIRSAVIFVLGLGLSMLASLLLARRMVAPIRVLQEGAARIGAGELGHRIEVRTGDELEALGDELNRTAGQLQESYANLEQKVDARTRELADANRDLTEALEQQTATAEILRVISSSPTDLQPVLDAVAENAARLCDASDAQIFRLDGNVLRLAASYGSIPVLMFGEQGTPVSRGWVTGRSVVDRQTIHVHDLAAETEAEFPVGKIHQAQGGHRTTLATPLLREGVPLGAILIRRMEVRPFSDKQIKLLETFADQAVIAIENVRLFKELEARNRDLTEALEQQTATGEVLRVIASSPTTLEPVLETVIANAVRLSGGHQGHIRQFDGELLQLVAQYGESPEDVAALRSIPVRPGPDSASGRAVLERRPIHIVDPTKEDWYRGPVRSLPIAGTILCVPLLREGAGIGNISIWRHHVEPFTQRQIDLVTTFADQAVIAIENVRLFKELQARTSELGRSVEELKALGEIGRAVSSTLDLETVLTTIASRADQLSDTDGAAIYEYDEAHEEFQLRVTLELEDELIEALRAVPIRLGEGAVGRAGVSRQPIQIPDILAEATYTGRLRDAAERAGYRALLAVPLLREDQLVGALVLRRKVPGAFPQDTIDLLQTFASQSVLAIENARLFREIEEKGRQLELASKHKSQFLANMSHELRTPMNAVLGYTDLILDNIFGDVPEAIRDTLERVKSNGQHLLGLINDVLDLSKIEAGQLTLSLGEYSMGDVVQAVVSAVESLAAEKKLALKAAVPADLPPGRGDERRLTQVLLNLVGNAIKFTDDGEVSIQARASDGAFVVSVSDTGPGISEADQRTIFEEFQQADSSSTRKKGGTGLGLSISRRIVELHGGRLWVESTPGRGSTFSFTLPVRVERQAERA
jgi:signal transduction histidine kinase/HAMP domain-containing protein